MFILHISCKFKFVCIKEFLVLFQFCSVFLSTKQSLVYRRKTTHTHTPQLTEVNILPTATINHKYTTMLVTSGKTTCYWVSEKVVTMATRSSRDPIKFVLPIISFCGCYRYLAILYNTLQHVGCSSNEIFPLVVTLYGADMKISSSNGTMLA